MGNKTFLALFLHFLRRENKKKSHIININFIFTCVTPFNLLIVKDTLNQIIYLFNQYYYLSHLPSQKEK